MLTKGLELDKTKRAEGDSGNVVVGVLAVGGIVLGLYGFWATLHGLFEWDSAHGNSAQEVEVRDEQNFEPVPYASVRAYAPSISKEWRLTTDSNGRVVLDIDEIVPRVRSGSSLQITLESIQTTKVLNDFTISSDLISVLKTPFIFTFESQIIPNEVITLNQIAKGGEIYLVLEIKSHNASSIDAHDILVTVNASKGVILKENSQLVSKLSANATGESLYFTFSLAKNLSSTKVTFTVSFSRKNRKLSSKEIYVDLGKKR